MAFTHNLLQLKTLLMILTTSVGAIAGGATVNSYANQYISRGNGIPQFILTMNPTTMTLGQNAISTSTISVTSINGYSGTVTLSLMFPGTRLTASLNPGSVQVPRNGIAKSTLTVSAPATIGNYTIVVEGISNTNRQTNYATGLLKVQVISNMDFAIAANPSSLIGPVGGVNTTTITVTSINGYTGNVSLSVTAPFGYITVTGGATLPTLTPGSTQTSLLVISTTLANTIPGTYTIKVTGTSGLLSHSATITLIVSDPILPPPPPPTPESLKLTDFSFLNGTSLQLFLQNAGNNSITLVSYTVSDATGNSWSLANWAGPTIASHASGGARILIGTNCSGCVYSGITGLFFQFQFGQAYTVRVTTANNNSFTFTMTRN